MFLIYPYIRTIIWGVSPHLSDTPIAPLGIHRQRPSLWLRAGANDLQGARAVGPNATLHRKKGEKGSGKSEKVATHFTQIAIGRKPHW